MQEIVPLRFRLINNVCSTAAGAIARTGFLFAAALTLAAGEPAPLSLAEALRLADTSSPALVGARAGSDEARAQTRAARAALQPRIALEGGAMRTDDPVAVFGGKLRQGRFGTADFAINALNHPAPITDFTIGARLDQPLFAGGALAAGRDAAARAAGAAEAGAVDERARARLEILRAYFTVPLADAAVAATRGALDLARNHTALLRAAVNAGTALETDLLRVEVFASGLESDLVRRESDAALARARLAALIGHPNDDFILTDPLDPEAPLPDGLARRDLGAARLARDAADAGRRVANAPYFPTAGLFAAWNQDRDGGASGRAYYTVGIGVRWTLYDGGRRAADADAARARADAARARVDGLEAAAVTDRRAAAARLDSARRRLGLAGQSRESAREVHRVAALREKAGDGLLSDTLDAEGMRLRIELESIMARYDVIVARAEAAYAAGDA